MERLALVPCGIICDVRSCRVRKRAQLAVFIIFRGK